MPDDRLIPQPLHQLGGKPARGIACGDHGNGPVVHFCPKISIFRIANVLPAAKPKPISMHTSELLNSYLVDTHTWDEMYTSRSVRPQYEGVVDFLQQMSI